MASANEKIDVMIDTTPEWTEIKLTINDGIAEYGGFIAASQPDRITAYALTVEPAYRGRGMGEMLVRKLVEVAKDLGVNRLVSHIESQYALDIRARIFGREALRFFDDSDENPDVYQFLATDSELPITFDQARQSLVRAEAYEESPEIRQFGFYVSVDLPSDAADKTAD